MSRPILYVFFDLPHHRRMAILSELGVLGDEDTEQEQYSAAFGRAKERGKLDDLREAIVRATESVDGGET